LPFVHFIRASKYPCWKVRPELNVVSVLIGQFPPE
jgi:hypothetical protein